MVVVLGLGGLIALIAIGFIFRNFFLIAILCVVVAGYLYWQDKTTSEDGDISKVEVRALNTNFLGFDNGSKEYKWHIRSTLKNNSPKASKGFYLDANFNLCSRGPADDNGDRSWDCDTVGSRERYISIQIPPNEVRQFDVDINYSNVPDFEDRQPSLSVNFKKIILEK